MDRIRTHWFGRRNTTKIKLLYILDLCQKPDGSEYFSMLELACLAGVPYVSASLLLPKWATWEHPYVKNKPGTKTYCITGTGRNFLRYSPRKKDVNRIYAEVGNWLEFAGKELYDLSHVVNQTEVVEQLKACMAEFKDLISPQPELQPA